MFVLTKENSIANQFLAELRDAGKQKDSMRFRRNMERLGEILAYEISKKLAYEPAEVRTPLGLAHTFLPVQMPVLAMVLRAALPFFQGFLNYFDNAECAFVAAYRAPERPGGGVEVKMDYLACPSMDRKPVILIDPMLATGKSLLLTYQSLLKFGTPSEVHVASVIASKAAIAYLRENIPGVMLWVGDVDQELNDKAYIVPGLGDAGDLSFGGKI